VPVQGGNLLFKINVTVYVTVYVTHNSQLSTAVQLWKEPNSQLLANSHGISNSSSTLSQLISVDAKASQDEAKNKRKQELGTTVVIYKKYTNTIRGVVNRFPD